MGGHLGIGAVELRVVEVGLVDPGLQVVRHEPCRDAAEEPERLDVALGPGPLVHLQDRPHEHVPRVRQHHDERPDGAEPPGHRVKPPAEHPVIDLRLLPGLGRVRVPHRHLPPAGLLRDVGGDVAAEARHARGQPVLIPQPLVDRRHPHPGPQLSGDVLVVHGDRRPRHLPQPRVRQLREPLPDQALPLGLASSAARPGRSPRPPPARRTSGSSSGPPPANRTSRSATGPHASARAAPRRQSRRTFSLPSAPRPRREATFLCLDGQVHHDTHAVPMGNYVIGAGNYVIATPSELGNYKIADTVTARTESDRC